MYDWVLRGLQLGGLGVLPMLWVYDAPFGKFGVPTSWNVHGAWPSDAGNLGWMVMEAVAPITAVVAALRAPAPSVASHVMLAVFVAHYVNRALVQPYLSPPRTPLHVSVVLSAILFNACNGYLQGSWLYAGGPPRALQGLGWGLAVCAAGAAGNIYHDGVLRRLRTTAPAPGEKVVQQGSSVYRIPHGGLFTWLSSPNYVCEWLEWGGWAAACVWCVPHARAPWYDYPPLLFLALEIIVMLPRAWRGHRWYVHHFGDAYPGQRRVLVPGVW